MEDIGEIHRTEDNIEDIGEIHMEESHDDLGGRRLRTLTEKGKEAFDDMCLRHKQRIRRAWEEVEISWNQINSCVDSSSLEELRSTLHTQIKTHDLLMEEFICYCFRTNTEKSLELGNEQSDVKHSRELAVFSATDELGNKFKELKTETSSMRSYKSKGSGKSDITTVIQIAKAKAVAAQVTFEYAEKEARLKKQRSDIDIDLELMSKKRDAAAVKAEADALESSEQCLGHLSLENTLRNVEPDVPLQRTREYIHHLPDTKGPDIKSHSLPQYNVGHKQQGLNADFAQNSVVSDISRFLLKKDLLLSRLTGFNDKPESYRMWKFSFRAIMHDLQVTALEELDMLQKWSGPESQKHVISIKAANVFNPNLSLQRIWERLDERFGWSELIEASLKSRVECFPKLSVGENRKLYDLADLVSEIESVKQDSTLKTMFAYYDSSTGVNPIVNKLPYNLQEKWTMTAFNYMKRNSVVYPPFWVLADFLREQSKIRNNPHFMYEAPRKRDQPMPKQQGRPISVKKTETTEVSKPENTFSAKCPLHLTDHSLNQCRVFKSKPLQERFKFLREHKLCFKCCESTSHMKTDCQIKTKCKECQSENHPTALHFYKHSNQDQSAQSHVTNHGGESNYKRVSTACTQICGNRFNGKSCAKIILGNIYLNAESNEGIKLYVMIDDQSNRSLATSGLFDLLGVSGNETEYILSSCSGKVQTSGRRISGLVIESLDRETRLELPTVTECAQIPDNRDEIPTPEVAMCYPHLQDITCHIPPLDKGADIMLLIGRDLIKAHHVVDQRIGPGNKPYAQKLPLGWTIIGESCLGNTHVPQQFNVNKTSVLDNGRVTLFEPCVNNFKLHDSSKIRQLDYNMNIIKEYELLGQNVFQRTDEDETPGLSFDDRAFLQIMDNHFQKDNEGNWTSPLPFRNPRQRLKNNYNEVLKRAKSLDKSLSKNSVKKRHFLDFMEKLMQNGFAELAPALRHEEESWYIPIFGVYHPQKQDQVRVVFDSAAKYGGLALNDVLLSGPDLTNSLLGVLMRFRREPVAVVADIQQMFYCFRVNEEHRNYLRFFWHADNDFDKEIVEFRMCVHVFGNTASPAVATYGLRKAVSECTSGSDVTQFVMNDFYVDDGLTSLRTVDEAISLIKRTQKVLSIEGHLRLHKIASNREEVMLAFSPEDLAKDITNIDLGNETLPTQRSLGVMWDLESDSFSFYITADPQPYTRRGLLSTVNSIFDPLGFLAPVVIEGKSLMRILVHDTDDWDTPLSEEQRHNWTKWRNSLSDLHSLKIPRVYIGSSFSDCRIKSVHIFSDASEMAIAAVGYLKASDKNKTNIGFILGKAKVAPSNSHTIPRLELCAAVLAVELAESISRHLSLPIKDFKFYTDSKVVLGYIHNQSRRFYAYVSNRVQRIRNTTEPNQWAYVSTWNNPADQGTRSMPASEMSDSVWVKGPSFLMKEETSSTETHDYDVHDPDSDKEVRPEIVSLKTELKENCALSLGSHRFSRFSSWTKLVETIARLRHVAQNYCRKSENNQSSTFLKTVETFNKAKRHIIKEVQKEAFCEEIECLKGNKPISKCSPISSLDPYLDETGTIRIGGRLRNASMTFQERNPILIPGRNHIALLIIRFYHEKIYHQGRHITAGAVRSAGFWITGAKRLTSSILSKCVNCRKLRYSLSVQKMADLPTDRVEPCPPFTNVGVDCFGPWAVVSRRTRGGQANCKRWAALFTCLSTRAIHIEVLEELSASSFINALKRFTAIRGPVKQLRSDQGTNFIGTISELGIDAVNVQECKVRDFLYNSGCTWVFNPPHASHMGGVWERLIGVTRRILDALLLNVPGNGLTHEVLTTFLAEASAIVNSRPLVSVSSDPDDPFPLSPSLLLTRKTVTEVIPLDLSSKDMYKTQWKRVQLLADSFWTRWRSQYLQTLQERRKWKTKQRNFMCGDVVLLRDKQVHRNLWPLGIVTEAVESDDGLVRSVKLRVIRDGEKAAVFLRPVAELVLLIPKDTQ